MENPIDFDIWCTLEKGTTKTAATWMAKIQSIALLDAFKAIRDLENKDGYVPIFANCGWDDIPKLRQELPNFAKKDSCIITESSYQPSECTNYCQIHLLRHTRQVCPVCENFYISRVIDGQRIVPQTFIGQTGQF